MALLGIALALITMRLDDKNLSREKLLTALDRQISLIGETPKEALLNGALLGLGDGALERAINAVNDHYKRDLSPLVSPGELSSDAIDKLNAAEKLWEAMQIKTRRISAAKAAIAKESETFLQLAPKLRQSTQELAQMMENRRVSLQTLQDAKKQVDLAERLNFIASVYLADGGNARYEELLRAIDNYSQTLYGFSNADNMQASVLALVGDNQLSWKDYQESLTKAIGNRKQMIDDIAEIYRESDALYAELNSVKTEIIGASKSFMRSAQIALTLLIAAAIGYAVCLLIPFRKERQSARKKEFVGEESQETIA
jgi:hypothetical protein